MGVKNQHIILNILKGLIYTLYQYFFILISVINLFYISSNLFNYIKLNRVLRFSFNFWFYYFTFGLIDIAIENLDSSSINIFEYLKKVAHMMVISIN